MTATVARCNCGAEGLPAGPHEQDCDLNRVRRGEPTQAYLETLADPDDPWANPPRLDERGAA